jgi:type II secretory pathway pseudopilin PulG
MKRQINDRSTNGFTLIEVMVSTMLTGLVIIAAIAALLTCKRMWTAADLELIRARSSSNAMQKIVSGSYAKPGLRMAEWRAVNPTVVISDVAGLPSRIDYVYGTNNLFIMHDGSGSVINESGDEICDNVSRLLFSFEPSRPGTLKVDLTLNFSPDNETEGITRLVTWVAMRNRT